MPKNERARRIDSITNTASGGILSVSGGGTATDHGTLSGLLDDDHSQYAGITQTETITGVWTFNPASGSPFLIGSTAAGILVTDLNADSVDGYDFNQALQTTDSPTFAGLTVNGNIVVTGNVDGVDISAHAANADAHHAGFIGIEDDSLTAVTPAADDRIQIVGGLGITSTAGTNILTLATAAGDTSITVNPNSLQVNLATVSGLQVSSGLMIADSIAGSGLTIAGKILAVGAGDGITVNANDVALTTPGTLSVSSANNAAGNHTHAITASSNPGAASALLKSDASGDLQLVDLKLSGALQDDANPTLSFLTLDDDTWTTNAVILAGVASVAIAIDSNANSGGQDFLVGKDDTNPSGGGWTNLFGVNESGDVTIYGGDLTFSVASQITTGAGNLTLVPTGDLCLTPGGSQVMTTSGITIQSDNFASQTTGWGVDYNGSADFRYLFTDELHAKAFIADLEQALAGGQIISKSVAVIASDFTLPTAGNSGTLVVEDLPGASAQAVFQANDIVRLRQFTRGAGSLTIADAWGVVTAYSDNGNGTQNWTFTRSSGGDAGTASGTVEKGSLALDYGTTGNGFYEVNAIDGAWAVNSPYAQIVTWATHPASGKTVRSRWGNLKGLTAVTEYGLYAGTGGVAATDQYLRISDQNFEIHNLDLALYNSGTQTVSIADDGNAWFGADSSNKTLQITTTGANAGDVEVGKYTASSTGILWDESAGQLLISGGVIVGNGFGPTVQGVLLYCPFSTPQGASDFQVNTNGHLGQQATLTGPPIGRPGKFGRGVEVVGATTNEAKNPVFENNVTDDWSVNGGGTYSRTQDTTRSYVGAASCKLDSGASWAYLRSTTDVSVPNGSTVWAQARVYRENSSYTPYVRIRDVSNNVDRVTTQSSVEDEWELLAASWTNDTGSAVNVRIQVGLLSGGPGIAWFDACQLEVANYPSAFTYGDMPNSAWSGTAHNSTSTRTASKLTYTANAQLRNAVNQNEGALMLWLTAQITFDGTAVSTGWGDFLEVRFGDAANDSLRVRNQNGGYVQLRQAVGGASDSYSATMAADTAYHVAFVWSKSGNFLKTYLDGAEVQTRAFPGYSSGCDIIETNTPSGGAILSDLVILNHALTADEVKAIADSDLPVNVASNNFELMLTGQGLGKVWGHAGGLFAQESDGTTSFALVNKDGTSWDGGTLNSGDFQLGTDAGRLLYDASVTTLFLGDVSGGDYLEFSPGNGIRMYASSNETLRLLATGDARFGLTGAGNANLAWDVSAGDLNMRVDTTGFFRLEGSTKNLLMGNGVGTDANVRFVYFGTAQTFNSESVGAGDLMLGSNSGGKANVFWDESAGQLLFRGGTTTQAYVDTDGSVSAGGGNVWLDSQGVAIEIQPKSVLPPVGSALRGEISSTISGGFWLWHANGDTTTMSAAMSIGGYPDSSHPEFRLFEDSTTKEAYLFNTGLSIGLLSGMGAGQLWASDYVRADGGLTTDSTDPGTGNLRVAGTAIVTGGINVGTAASAGTGQVRASDYVRADGGLTTDSTDPGTGNLRVAGTAIVTGGDVTVSGGDLIVSSGTVSRKGFVMCRKSSAESGFAGALTDIDFNYEVRKDSAYYTHSNSTNPDNITFDTAGWYRVSYTILVESTKANRQTVRVKAYLNAAVVNGSTTQQYVRYNTYGKYASLSTSFPVQAAAGDVLDLRTDGQAGTAGFGSGCSYTIMAESQITIEKIDA